ncbi:MAG: Ig-like domain-containing protein [Propionibacteriaceae bacterium]|jgi:selenophosphate synthetase-related protein|nr:Ig-like domain-containing protein [Propionibacteriaceae bacterium]
MLVFLTASLTVGSAMGFMFISAPKAGAATTTADYSQIFYFTDVRWWHDADPGDGTCATSDTASADTSLHGVCTLLAATEEANAWSAAHPDDTILITPAEASSEGSLTGLDPRNGWAVRKDNWAIAPLDTTSEASPRYGNDPSFDGMLDGMDGYQSGTLGVMGGAGSEAFGNQTTLLYFTANNVTIDLQNRVGFWISGSQCWDALTAASCSVVMGLNGTNQILQNFGTADTASRDGDGYGLMMLNSEDNVTIGQNARNVTVRNGYIGNAHTEIAGMTGDTEAWTNERGITVIGGAEDITVDNVVIDGLASAGVAILPNGTDTTSSVTPVKNLTIKNSTISMQARQDYNNYSYLGVGVTGQVGRNSSNAEATNVAPGVDGLHIVNNKVTQFTLQGSRYFDDDAPGSPSYNMPIDLSYVKFTGTTNNITNNVFEWTDPLRNWTPGAADAKSVILLSNVDGEFEIADNVFRHDDALANPQFPAIRMARTGSYSGTIDHVWIHDNVLAGWGSATNSRGIYADAYSSSVYPTYTAERNIMPGSLSGTAASIENQPGATSSNPVDNAGTYANAQPSGANSIRTWYPGDATIDGSYLTVPLNPPDGGSGSDPVYPVQVDVYTGEAGTNASGMATYVGRAQVESAEATSVTLPFASGAADLVRLQTIDANGLSSQMSRTAAVAGEDTLAPMLWIDKVADQEATTSLRAIRFTLMSSEPLTGGAGAITSDLITNDGTAGAWRSVDVQPQSNSADNTQWTITVKVDRSGTVVPVIAADVVTDLAGLANTATNTVGLPNPNDPSDENQYTPASFLGSPNNDGVGYPIDALPGNDTVNYLSPLSITDTTAEVDEPDTAGYYVVTVRNTDNIATVAPVAYVYIRSDLGELTPDSTITPDPKQTAAGILEPIGNNPGIGAVDPYGSTGDATTMGVIGPVNIDVDVPLHPIDNNVLDGTRTVVVQPHAISADPNYDGLELAPVTVTVTDDDALVSGELSTTGDNAPSDCTTSNTVVAATPRNAAGEAVANATVTVTLPKRVNLSSDDDALPEGATAVVNADGTTTITAVTDGTGTLPLKIVSCRAGTFTVTGSAKAPEVTLTSTDVTFEIVPLDPTKSTFQVSQTDVAADGTATATITVTAKRANGSAAPDIVTLLDQATTTDDLGTGSISSWTEKNVDEGDGVYTATVSSSKIGDKAIATTVTIEGVTTALAAAGTGLDEAHFVAGDPSDITVAIDNATALAADGAQSHVVTVTLADVNGNPVTGKAAALTAAAAPAAGVTISAFSETETEGTYTANVSSTSSGDKTITVSYAGTADADTVVAVFKAGAPDASQSTFEIEPATSVTAGDTTGFTGTLTVRDANGNLVTGTPVAFSGETGLTVAPTATTTDENGEATVKLTSRWADTYDVSAFLGDTTGAKVGETKTVTFVPGAASAEHSTLTVTTDGTRVVETDLTLNDPTTLHQAAVTVRDINDNEISGQEIVFTVTGATRLIVDGVETSNSDGSQLTIATPSDANGVARLSVASTIAGEAEITATLGGTEVKDSPADVTFVASDPVAGNSQFSLTITDTLKTSVIADGEESYTARVLVRDANGNHVGGVTVDFDAATGALVTNASGTAVNSAVSNNDPTSPDYGYAEVFITATKAGSYAVTGKIAGTDQEFSPSNAIFGAGPASAEHSSIAVTTTGSKTADGADYHVVVATVRDANDNVVADAPVTFELGDLVTISKSDDVTDANGTITLHLASTAVGTFEVAALVGDVDVTNSPVELTYAAGTPAAATLDAAPSPLTVGSVSTATATVTDADGHPVPDVQVSFYITSGAAVFGTDSTATATTITAPTNTAGKAIVSVFDLTAEEVTVTAAVPGVVAQPMATIVYETATFSAANSSFAVVPTTESATEVVADGIDSWTGQLVARDVYGNVLTNLDTSLIEFTASSTEVTVSPTVTLDKATGAYEVTFTSQKALDGTASTAIVTFNKQAVGQSEPIPFVAGEPDPSNSTLVLDTTKTPVGQSVTATATILDANDNPVKDVEVTFAATGSATFTDDVVTLKTNADGVAEVTLTDAVAEAVDVSATISIKGADTPIGQTRTVTFEDVTAPTAPVITAPVTGAAVTTTTPTITGTGEVGATVVVKDGSTVICETTVGEDGAWTCPVTTPLAQGAHSITATLEDAAGNESAPSAAVGFTVDSIAPAAPSIDTANATTIGGQGTPGSIVTVTVPGVEEPLTATVGPDGAWSVATPEGATDGGEITAVASDAAGNTSDPTTKVIDLTAPEVPVISTANATTIAGTAEPNSTVTITVPGVEEPVTVPVDAEGKWSVTTPEGATDGTIAVTATDPAGNVSPEATATLDVSTPAAPAIATANATTIAGTAEPNSTVTITVPGIADPVTVPVDGTGNWSIPTPEGATDGEVSATVTDAAGNVSPAATATLDVGVPGAPVISTANATEIAGTAEPGSTVTITVPGVADPVTVPVGEDGKWSVETPAGATDGQIVVTATDADGNVSPEATATLDVSTPAAPVISTANATTIAGTAEPNSTVTITVPGVEEPVTVPVDAEGKWSVETPEGATDGQISATVTDPAGNVSPEATATLDVSTPAAPVISTANATTIAGTAEPNSTVTITVPGIADPVTVPVDGTGTWSIATPEGATDGQISATVTDAAGNVSPAATATLDIGVPDVPVISTANATTIAGTAEPGSTVTITVPGVEEPVTVPVDDEGKWSVETPDGATDGDIVGTATDAAGNVSPEATATLDVSSPSAPVISTANATEIAGTAEPNSTVTITVPGVEEPVTVPVDGTGNWSITTPEGATDGEISATVTDAAGNVSPEATATLDVSTPAAPVIATANATTIAGTAEPNSTVTITVPGIADPVTVPVDGTGNWSITTPEGATDGEVSATATDPAGNVSPSVTATLDVSTPVAPVISTANATEIAGTAEPNSTVTITVPGVEEPVTVPVDAEGNWSVETPEGATDGQVSATVTDAAGNVSPAATATLDVTVPSAPVISTANATEIAGTAEPNSTVTVTVPGIADPVTVPVDGTGNWSITTPEGATDGQVSATVTDAAGNVSPAATATLDVGVPSAPVIETANATEIAGTAEPNSTVTITVPGVDEPVTVPVDAEGKWSVPTPEGATDGPISATVTDDEGNVSPSATGTIDVTIPDPPVIETANATEIGGTAEPNATLTITVPGIEEPITVPVDAEGNWSISTPEGATSGSIVVTTATDGAGNVSEEATATLDIVAPAAPVVETANATTIAGTAEPNSTVTITVPGVEDPVTVPVDAEGNWSVETPEGATDGDIVVTATDAAGNTSPETTVPLDVSTPEAPEVTTANATTIAGTAEPNSTVTITVPGVTEPITVPVDAEGNWSVTTPEGATDGDIVVTATDPAGNVSPSTTVPLDVSTPEAPEVTTANATEIAGTAEPNSTVTITVPGVTEPITVPVDAEGNWSVTTPEGATDGDIVVTATDAAGNVSPETTVPLDVSTPTAPEVTTANETEIAGTAEPGSTVTITVPGVTEPITVPVDAEGNWSVETPEGASDGEIVVTATDPAGNVSPETTTTLDVSTPTAPVVSTANATEISGTAEPGSTVTITVPGVDEPVTVPVDENGNWSVETPEGATDGEIVVTATDPAGNVSPETTATLDVSTPDAPEVSTANATEIAGTAEPGSTVTITVPGVTDPVTVPVDGEGNWSVPTPQGATDGQIVVTATDPAGNVSPETTATLDVGVPAAPVVETANATEIAGTAEPGSTVTITVPGVADPVTVPVDGEGNWSVPTPQGATDGQIVVTATDDEGNVSPSAVSTIDVTIPDPPVIETANGTEIAGTAEPGTTLTITVPGVEEPITVPVDAEGNWSIPTPEGATSGSIVVTTATDGAGNVSAEATADLDILAPDAPVVETANATEIAGTAEPNSTVTITVPGVADPITVPVDAEGNWSIPTPEGAADGDIVVTATDAAGNVSPETTVPLDVSTPTAPEVETANATEIAGTAEPGSTVTITVPGVDEPITVPVDENGNWSVETPEGATDGDIVVTATDAAGNTSPSTTVPLDVSTPEAPEVETANASEIAGTAEPGSTVTITVPGVDEPITVPVDENGNWSVETPEGATDGDIVVTATDPAGNVSPETTVPLDVSTPDAPEVSTANATEISGTAEPGSTVTITVPGVDEPITVPVDDEGNWSVPTPQGATDGDIVVTATDPAGNVSPETTVPLDVVVPEAPQVNPSDGSEVSGVTEPGSTVTVTDADGNVLCTDVADPVTGEYSCEPQPTPADGEELTVTTTDPAGNTSPATSVTVDSTAPQAPVVDPSNGSVISGTAEPGSTVDLKDTFGNTLCSTPADPVTGAFSCAFDPALPDTGVVLVTATDAAGNTSPEASVTIDGSAPATPTVDPSDGSTISGTAEPGTTVTVTDADGNVLCTDVADATTGEFSCQPQPTPADGDVVTVTSTDEAGNVSQPPATVTIDSVAPAAPQVTTANAATIAGKAEPASVVTITVPGVDEPITVQADLNGNWSIPTPAGAENGDLVVTATDAAGNVSDETVAPLDVTTPGAPAVAVANATEISGRAEPNSTVTITVPGVADPITVPVDEKGNWSVPTPAGAQDGELVVTSTDAAGNVSPETKATLDVGAPVAPVVQPTDGITITGVAEPGSTVTVTDADGTVLCETTANEASGAFSCFPTPLPDLGDEVAVTSTDKAGNVSPSTTVTIGSGVLDLTDSEIDNTVAGVETGGIARVADDADTFVVTISLADGLGQPMTGLADHLTIEVPADTTVTAIVDNGDGTYTALLRSAVPTTKAVIAYYDGNQIGEVMEAQFIGAEVEKPVLQQGTEQVIIGLNFRPGETVTGVIHSTPIELGSVVADANGVATFRTVLPADFEVGAHTATLTGELSGAVEVPFEVTSTPVLPVVIPDTGNTVGPWLIGGTVLVLALGAGFLLLGGRRRDDARS